ncbi:NAD(P)-dependent oxidoreductase [bacterium]|nr:NAD(P)-dependent oxidoreductase [bacterium]
MLRHQVEQLVLEAPELWSDLDGGRIFITGASGFFGCWLLETLLWAKQRLALEVEVVALTRAAGRFSARVPHLASQVALWEGDVQDFPFPDGAFSHILHGAAEVGSGQGIVAGGQRVLELAQRSGAHRCLLTSSGAVYGPASGFLSEDQALAPTTDYGRAKLELEEAWGQRAISARCFAFIGPYLSLQSGLAAADFLREALAGRPLKIQGNGLTRRSYLYAGELAIWLWTLLLRGKPGRSYNVGSMQAVTVQKLAEQIAAEAGGLSVEVLGSEAGSDYLPDTSRAQKELGLIQRISLPESVARTWKWFRSIPSQPT